MMNNFSYVKAGSLAEAIKASSAKDARLHAGGTDLLGCLRDEIFQTEKIVSISNIRELKGISSRTDGSMRIGAMTAGRNCRRQRYRCEIPGACNGRELRRNSPDQASGNHRRESLSETPLLVLS